MIPALKKEGIKGSEWAVLAYHDQKWSSMFEFVLYDGEDNGTLVPEMDACGRHLALTARLALTAKGPVPITCEVYYLRVNSRCTKISLNRWEC